MTLKKYDITPENYLDECHHLRAVAAVQPTPKDGKELRKLATKIQRFFETPIEEHSTSASDRVGLTFVDRVIFNYYDRSKKSTSRLREWSEFMLIAEDGNHYEIGEISQHGRRDFPLLSEAEILREAKIVRSQREHSIDCD
jgi:hypothetical protein